MAENKQSIVNTFVFQAFGIQRTPLVGKWMNTDCPVCGSRMGLIANQNGSIGLNCRCGRTEDILAAKGLSLDDLRPGAKRKRRIVARPLTAPTNKSTAVMAKPFLMGGWNAERMPTKIQTKLFILALAQVRRGDRGFSHHVAKAADIWRMFGNKESPSYGDLHTIVKECLSLVRTAQVGERIVGVHLFDSEGTYVDLQDKTVHLQLSQECIPWLQEIDKRLGYTRFRPYSALALESNYSIWLYLLLSQFANQGWRKDEHFIDADELAKAMGVIDKQRAARLWWQFEQDVLRPARTEIETKTELRFSYSVVRRGGEQRGEPIFVRFFNVRTDKQVEQENAEKSELIRQLEDIQTKATKWDESVNATGKGTGQ